MLSEKRDTWAEALEFLGHTLWKQRAKSLRNRGNRWPKLLEPTSGVKKTGRPATRLPARDRESDTTRSDTPWTDTLAWTNLGYGTATPGRLSRVNRSSITKSQVPSGCLRATSMA